MAEKTPVLEPFGQNQHKHGPPRQRLHKNLITMRNRRIRKDVKAMMRDVYTKATAAVPDESWTVARLRTYLDEHPWLPQAEVTGKTRKAALLKAARGEQ